MGFDEWKKTIDDAIKNTAWDDYDSTIVAEMAGYNLRFGSTPNYVAVPWKLIKAMIWTESGGPASAAWKARVMQIGNPGDAGWSTLSKGLGGDILHSEGSEVIISQELQTALRAGNIQTPTLNIRAGLAYLFTRMARWELKTDSVPVNEQMLSYTVKSGDTLDRLAKALETTTAEFLLNNPKATVLHPKDVLKYRKAKLSYRHVITGWRTFSTDNIANLYNVGDSRYKEKLEYALALMDKLQPESRRKP